MKENKTLKYSIWAFTAVVYVLVIALHEILPKPDVAPEFTSYQPVIHAAINGSCFLLLIFSLMAVKKGNVALHQKLNTIAMLLSVVFLLSYVLYHTLASETIYGGGYKGLYYSILASHIILAGLSLPAILFAFYRGYIGDVEKHRKIVKWTYPVWLYVTFTGVLVYLFLRPYYA